MQQPTRLYVSDQRHAPDEKIAPLNEATFIQRLKDLEASVKSLAKIKAAMESSRVRS